MRIPTTDTEGRPNGWVQPVWSVLESPELRPEQVYITAIAPRSRKGPHCHHVRRGFFVVISGTVRIRWKDDDTYYDLLYGEKGGSRASCVIDPGIPCALYNYGDTEALVLNLPSPAWSADNPDEHPVENWEDPEDWPR